VSCCTWICACVLRWAPSWSCVWGRICKPICVCVRVSYFDLYLNSQSLKITYNVACREWYTISILTLAQYCLSQAEKTYPVFKLWKSAAAPRLGISKSAWNAEATLSISLQTGNIGSYWITCACLLFKRARQKVYHLGPNWNQLQLLCWKSRKFPGSLYPKENVECLIIKLQGSSWSACSSLDMTKASSTVR
jgi:hypothetical protein